MILLPGANHGTLFPFPSSACQDPTFRLAEGVEVRLFLLRYGLRLTERLGLSRTECLIPLPSSFLFFVILILEPLLLPISETTSINLGSCSLFRPSTPFRGPGCFP